MPVKPFKRVISILTLVTFIFTNSVYAAPDSKSIFKNKKVDYQKISDKNEGVIQQKKAILKGEDVKQAESEKKESQRILSTHLSDISLIHVPSELGRVVEVYQSPSKDNSRLIVHIQDLHTNPEAELNMAKILEILLKDYNLGLVCSEGADGAVDTSSVSSFPDPEVREKVARLFVDSGELTGEEYLSITKYPDLPIWGIENKDIYFKNIEEFNKIMEFNPNSQVFITQAKKALEELRPKIYSKELLSIDQKEADYENQKVETADYLKYLSSYIQKLGIPTVNYKNITLLNETTLQESRIDQQKIMQESQNMLLNLQSAIASTSNRSDIDILMAQAKLFKDQKASPFSFYSYLKDLANKHLKDDLSKKYPNLLDFVDYLTKVNSLDSTKLFIEMEDLTYDIKQRLAKNDEEKTLTQALRNIKFLGSFFNLKVSNEELDYYLQNRDSCKVGFFEAFLKPTLKKYSISSFVDYNPNLIDSHLKQLEDFYNIAKSRDLAMFNNTVSEVEKRNIKVASLITGGFHTKGLTKLLKEKGYSYIVISPFSKTEIDEENYRFLLSGKRKPIEELIKQLDMPEAASKLSATAELRVPLSFDSDSGGRRFKGFLTTNRPNELDGGVIVAEPITTLAYENPALKSWIMDTAQFTGAEDIKVIDATEDDRLLEEAVAAGELIRLPYGNYYARSHPQDVARSEARTFVVTSDPQDKGAYNNWQNSDTDTTLFEAKRLVEGSMKNKTMYVIPYLMGPPGSPVSQVGVQVTDSRYVVIIMIRMTKVGRIALEALGNSKKSVPGVHSTGDLDNIRRAAKPGEPDDRFFLSAPNEGTGEIWSYGSAYGGNALLAKKFHSLRQAGYDARKSDRLAEHMLILGIEDLETNQTRYIAAAFPSASGKTNLAMLQVPEALSSRYKVWLVGDDIAWLYVGKDGKLYAINPENGIFGVAPGTNERTNPNAMSAIGPGTKTIFTNVAYNELTSEVWWEEKTPNYPEDLDGWMDWEGKPISDRPEDERRNPKVPWAHPNSRFTTWTKNVPNISPHWQDTEGVPISAIFFGGRMTKGEPLIRQLANFVNGVYDGAMMAVETTAAATGQVGVVRRDPMAMRPFFSYNEGDYFKHWLEVMEHLGEKAPAFFHVNWFRKGSDGKFLWPGYVENFRALLWALERIEGKADAVDTPIGFIPTKEALNLEGLSIPDATLVELLTFDGPYWEEEARLRTEYFEEMEKKGVRWPEQLLQAHNSFTSAIEHPTETVANPSLQDILSRSELSRLFL